MEVKLETIPIMYVETTNIPAGISMAFDELESYLKSFKGRKFYGAYDVPNGIYRAGVAIREGDDPAALGLCVYEIPAGIYAREKFLNWSNDLLGIGKVFDWLSEQYKGRVDSTRPSIEFYRSQRELLCLLPIIS